MFQRFSLLGPAFLFALLATSACVASGSAKVSVRPGHFFGHDLTQSESVIYVLDLSGSMSSESGNIVGKAGIDLAGTVAGELTGRLLGQSAGGAAQDRIEKLKKKVEKVKLHLNASLAGLPNGSKFNIILFSNEVVQFAPEMITANGASKLLVGVFVDRLEEGGSTNMRAALEAAFNLNASQIILLTDGLPTSSSPEAIIDMARRHNRDGRFSISTVGVGNDQAREFLNRLAMENAGVYTSYD